MVATTLHDICSISSAAFKAFHFVPAKNNFCTRAHIFLNWKLSSLNQAGNLQLAIKRKGNWAWRTILHLWCTTPPPFLCNDQTLLSLVPISYISETFPSKSFSHFSNKVWCCCASLTISDFIFWWLLETIYLETVSDETMVRKDGQHSMYVGSKLMCKKLDLQDVCKKNDKVGILSRNFYIAL